MKFTYNWLKDFVAVKLLPEELAERLTMAGLEVTSLEAKDGDFVFEIEITSNRPDWLSVSGIAREVAVITNSAYRAAIRDYKKGKEIKLPGREVKIENADKKDCPLYTARVINEVNVADSPNWLKERLELVGCRSVNNIVDITNYTLFECGEPLHAFDLDKLDGNTIIIRRAKENEKIVLINGEEKVLDPDILVIADRSKPVAIAGVMGGKDTEVGRDTRNILLEAALFNPILVRRGRRKLGIQSESSYRFERGVAYDSVEVSSLRALGLIRDIAGGRSVFSGSRGLDRPKRTMIILDVALPERILGISIPQMKIKSILTGLGFKILNRDNSSKAKGRKKKSFKRQSFKVEIPDYRADVKSGIDLVEEVARIFGYDRVPSTMPLLKPQLAVHGRRDEVLLIKNILTGLGLNEVITYSLMDKELFSGFDLPLAVPVEIENPLSKAEGFLRPSLIPSITNCLAYNLNQAQEYISVFEIAKIFSSHGLCPNETLSLAIGVCGVKTVLLEEGVIKDKFGILHLKGVVETVFKRLGVVDFSFVPSVDRQGKIAIAIKNEVLGVIMLLEKEILDKFGIKNKEAAVLEISLDKLWKYVNLRKKFSGIPKYPGIFRDISFVLREEVSLESILKAIKEQSSPLLQEVKVIDYYKGKQIPEGFRGVTISCYYRSEERTLTEKEITPFFSSVSNILIERFGAKVR